MNSSQTKRRKFIRYWILRFKRFINLNIDHNEQETINRIENGIEIGGANVWILAFAIIIASIGLNVNSTAVIIGAMLISPLMGPIMGIGLSVGIADNELLSRSLKNFISMVVVSLISSTVYFTISPISDVQSELLARTQPTIYDVMIAFFGGLTGMVANSRKDEKITIISGVAIATALMPPLCTAGYGLSIGNFSYFFGAFYLFFINSFFIALATAMLTLYLKLPKKSFLNPIKEKKMKQMIAIFSILVCVPSVFTTFGVIQKAAFNSNAIHFMNNLQDKNLLNGAQIINSSRNFNRKESTIEITLVGTPLSDEQINKLQLQLPEYNLKKTKLIIHQPLDNDVSVSGFFAEELYNKNLELQEEIKKYQNEIQKLTQNYVDNEQIARELAVQFNNLESFSVVSSIQTNVYTLATDTIPTLYATWINSPTENETSKLKEFLKIRLNLKKLDIINKEKN